MALPVFSEPGVCDAHVHIVGPADRYPLIEGATGHFPKEALTEVHQRLGIDRSVLVQSARHGTDNTVIEEAIGASGGRLLGVAVVDVDVADHELARLAAAGIRGVRFNFMRHVHTSARIEDVIALTPRLARFQLHLQVHFESHLIHSLAPHLQRAQVPVVIDHMGRVDASLGAAHEDFAMLLRLLHDERFLVKVSGVDRIDRQPPYTAGVALARQLVAAFPSRCLWGSDWPHLNHHHTPDDSALAALTVAMAPDPELRHRLLVANPAAFYRFAAPPIRAL